MRTRLLPVRHAAASNRVRRLRTCLVGPRAASLALGFLVFTAARSGEVRKASRDEIDPDGATWTVPAERRMKANREHRVPSSKRALEVLAGAAGSSDGSGLVFPGPRPSRPPSEHTHVGDRPHGAKRCSP